MFGSGEGPLPAHRLHPGPPPGLRGRCGRRAGDAGRRARAGAPRPGAGVVVPPRAHAGPPHPPPLRGDVRVRRPRAGRSDSRYRPRCATSAAIRLLTTASTPASTIRVMSSGSSTVQVETSRPARVHGGDRVRGHEPEHGVPVLGLQLVEQGEWRLGAVDPREPDAGLGRQRAQLAQRLDVAGDEQRAVQCSGRPHRLEPAGDHLAPGEVDHQGQRAPRRARRARVGMRTSPSPSAPTSARSRSPTEASQPPQPLERLVVQHDDGAVAGAAQIDLDHVRPLGRRRGEGGQRVLAVADGLAAVGDGDHYAFPA